METVFGDTSIFPVLNTAFVCSCIDWHTRYTAYHARVTYTAYSMYPVSYTHLDVYKRQVQGFVLYCCVVENRFLKQYFK